MRKKWFFTSKGSHLSWCLEVLSEWILVYRFFNCAMVAYKYFEFLFYFNLLFVFTNYVFIIESSAENQEVFVSEYVTFLSPPVFILHCSSQCAEAWQELKLGKLPRCGGYAWQMCLGRVWESRWEAFKDSHQVSSDKSDTAFGSVKKAHCNAVSFLAAAMSN